MRREKSCWNFLSPKRSSILRRKTRNDTKAKFARRTYSRPVRNVSDCAWPRKYRKLPFRKAAAARRVRIRTSNQGDFKMIYSSARRGLLAGAFVAAFTLGAAAQ